MALFKISKGLSKNLMTNVPYAKEGFAYFTSDDGKFYIDIDGDGTNASPAVIGDNRIPLSALSTDWIKATKIEDTETYPILAFKVADNTKDLIELKYGSIGYKDGTLVIPNVETGSKDEVLIENNDEGSALIIDNKGAGTGIKIINTGEDSLVNSQGINIDNNILLNMNGSASFNGPVTVGNTNIFKGSPANILGTNKTNTIISNQLTLQQGAVFGGNAQNAGLVTRGICGVSTPTDDGACEKDNLYINYDGDNSYKASRHVILQAGEAGENYGNNLYQYAAARGDAVHDWSLNNFYIKSDIDNKLNNLLATNDAMVFKGTIGGDAAATIHELPATHSAGETYRVYDIKGGNNGKYLGNGEVCEIGDLIICIKDGTTHSAGDWTIVQTNIDGAVINTDGSSTDGHIAIFSGDKGRIIKDSGKSLDDLATANHTHTKLVNGQYAVDFNGASLSPINNPQNTIDLGNISNPWKNLYLTSDIQLKDTTGNWETLTEKLADKSNVGHKHTIADTDGLQTALDNKSNTGHTHTISNITDLQDTLDNKAAKSHSHEISDITNLQKTLNSKSDTGHKHEIADINKLQAALDGKSDTGHTHQITANVDTSNSKEDALIKLEGTGGINAVSYKATHADKGPSMADNVSSITTASNANKSLVGEFGKTLTLNIPRITIDKQGHVNTATNDEVSIALPSAPTIGNGKLTIKVGKTPIKVNETFTANQTTNKDIPLPVYTITETDTLLNGKANSSHTHNYAGSSSAGGPATSANKLNTNNVGSETAPVYFKDGIPVVTGLTLDRDISGNAETATIAGKVEHALSISVGGTPKGSYDGSAARTIDVNAADLKISGALVYIGRVATKPTSSQVTLIDGTTITAVAGNVVICTGDKKEYLYDTDGNWVDLGSSTSYALKPHIHGNISSDGYLTNEAGEVQTNSIVYSDPDGKISKGPTFDTTNTTKRFLAENGNWEQSSHHTSGSWNGLTYTAKSVNNAGELKFTIPTGTGANQVAAGNHNHDSLYPKKDGSGASGTWGININGNASTATKLTNLTTADEASSTDTWRRVWFAYNDNATGRPAYSDTFAYQSSTGTVKATKFQGSLSGNAATATKLATARTISLTGSITGSGTFDGSGNLSIATSTNHSHDDRYYTESEINSKLSGKSDTGHTHNYAGSSSAGGVATSSYSLQNKGTLDTQDKIDNFLTANQVTYATFKTANSNNIDMESNDGIILSLPWTSTSYGAQIAFDDATSGTIKIRGKSNNSWGNWYTLLHSGNYTDYTVKKDGTGASGTWGISISGNAASASKVNNKLTVGSKSYDGSAAVTIAASDLGLASAMLFLGTTTTAISDGATKNPVTIGGANKTVTAGNVVLYGSKEFVWTGSAWEELGNEGSYKIVQAAIADPSASGTSNTFIATISQDTNGKITATKKTVAVTNSAPTLSWGATSTIGSVAGTNLQVKMPANPNTDTKVAQTAIIASNYTNWRPLIWGSSNSGTEGFTPSTITDGVYTAQTLSCQPSSGTIRANTFKGSLSGNAATATNADKLDGYHENSFLRHRDAVSGSGGTSHFNSLWSQIGIRQYNNALPDAMADNTTYTYGAVVSLPGVNSRLDLWYNHQTSTNGNGLMYRTGWNDDIKAWATILDNVNYPGILNSSYVKKTGDTMSGNLIVSRSNTIDTSVRTANSKGSIGLLSSTNRGLYDFTNGKWLIYTDGTKASTSYALYGAVWNDYAEFRKGDTIEAGRCVIEVGDDTLITSTERMMPGANITSDTFGFAIGETEQAKTPIAVSGRVLAYPYESREEFKKNIGRPVCSGPNGTVSIMTDEEYRDKGYCAIGTISAVPDYEEWGTGKVKVNGRVWIKVF